MSEFVKPEAVIEQSKKVVPLRSVETPSTLKTTYARDLADDDLLKVWMIDDFLGAGEYTVVYGLPGCGKSVFIGDGACHVAAGRKWFDRDVTPGVVLYLAAERSKLVRRRVNAWKRRHRCEDFPLAIVEGIFDLVHSRASAEEVLRIGAQASADFGLPVVWIIIDTKAQVMAGGDPNSDQEASAFNTNIAVLQQCGAHVTVIDHVPHSSPERMKGSGAFAGAADGSFLIKNEGFARTVNIGSKAPNDGPDEMGWAFTLDSVPLAQDAKGKWTTAPIVVPAPQQDPRMNPDAKAGRGPKLKAEWVIILRAMGLLIDHGEGVRVSSLPGVSPGQMGVKRAILRPRAVQIGYSAGNGEEKVIRSSFDRDIRKMISANIIRQDGDTVWRVAP